MSKEQILKTAKIICSKLSTDLLRAIKKQLEKEVRKSGLECKR